MDHAKHKRLFECGSTPGKLSIAALLGAKDQGITLGRIKAALHLCLRRRLRLQRYALYLSV